MHISSLVDLGRYPLDLPTSKSYADLLANIHTQINKDGCAVLKGFVHEKGVEILAAEGDSVAHKAHRSFNRTNVSFTKDDPSLPSTHPLRQFLIAQMVSYPPIILARKALYGISMNGSISCHSFEMRLKSLRTGFSDMTIHWLM